MSIPESVTELAGFTAGHALWNLSDMPDDELLCPMAFVENGSRRELMRFEADSQEAAMDLAFRSLAEKPNLQAWAIARDGVMRLADGPSDVLIIEAWCVGMGSPITFVQRYRPFASGNFLANHRPMLLQQGEVQAGEQADDAIAQLRSGILSHEKAEELWSSWQGW